jgi:translation elongation factor P/translation initiation factor 5A
MKTKTLNWAAMALVPAAILTFTSCSSSKGGSEETTLAAQEGVPGGTLVETHKTQATVTGIDPASREVTMVTPEGKKSKYTAGPEIRNFDQIQIGDQVKATVTKTVHIRLLEPGETLPPGQSSNVAVSPEGSKPGVMKSETTQATARIEVLDAKKRKVTLRYADGDSETYDVRKDVDMSKARVGQDVLIRATEAKAIRVEKP